MKILAILLISSLSAFAQTPKPQVKQYPPGEVFKISGRVLEKSGSEIVILTQEPAKYAPIVSSMASIGGGGNVALPEPAPKFQPSPGGRVIVLNHPKSSEIGLDEKIEFFAVRNGTFKELRKFDYIEPVQIAGSESQIAGKTTPKAFPPSALDKK